MHDGTSLTFTDAILRHGGEAEFVINRYRNLTRLRATATADIPTIAVTPIGDEDLTPRPRLSDARPRCQAVPLQHKSNFLTDYLQTS